MSTTKRLSRSENISTLGKSFRVEDGDLVYNDQGQVEIVSDLENLAQGVERILKTPLGENPLYPYLGVDYKHFFDVQDEINPSEAQELLLVMIEQAITEQEDRVARIDEITAGKDEQNPRLLNISIVVITNQNDIFNIETVIKT